MKSHYEARALIRAPRAIIWEILTDSAAYPSWNSTILELDGAIELGSKLAIRTTIDPKRAFRANVSEIEPEHRMVWSFSAPLGMFKGARSFTLEDTPEGVLFHTREDFSGWMAGPIVKKMPDLQPSFDAWAECLKREAEARAAQGGSARAA